MKRTTNSIIEALKKLFGMSIVSPIASDYQVQAVQPQATPTAIPTSSPTPMPDQFTFDMGKDDYGYLKPSVAGYYEKRGNPPASQYVDTFMEMANRYGVDPRVLMMISGIESSDMKNYPKETNNPFGYLVDGGGVKGLSNAGFTSVPHAIDRIGSRFGKERNKYPAFSENPTISNLQSAYNANPAERENYLKLAYELLGKMR